MNRYLVLEQAGADLRGSARTSIVNAHNVKDAITKALDIDDTRHIRTSIATATTQLLVIRVAEIAAINVHHHLPTVATLDELRYIHEGD